MGAAAAGVLVGRETANLNREVPFTMNGWEVTFKPPIMPSTFLMVAGSGELLTGDPYEPTQVTRMFNQPDADKWTAPASKTVSILAPLNQDNKPTIIAKSGGERTVHELDLPAFRYDSRGARLLDTPNPFMPPVLVSPVDLQAETSKPLSGILRVTQDIFTPFAVASGHTRLFTTYIVPDSSQVHTSTDGTSILLGLKTITDPDYRYQAEIETFATAAEVIYSAQFAAMHLEPQTATQVSIVIEQWKKLRKSWFDRKEPAPLEKLFAKGTYTGEGVTGFNYNQFSSHFGTENINTALFADALTIMRYFLPEFIDGYNALESKNDKKIARDRLNAALQLLKDGNRPESNLSSQIDWDLLIPRFGVVTANFGFDSRIGNIQG